MFYSGHSWYQQKDKEYRILKDNLSWLIFSQLTNVHSQQKKPRKYPKEVNEIITELKSKQCVLINALLQTGYNVHKYLLSKTSNNNSWNILHSQLYADKDVSIKILHKEYENQIKQMQKRRKERTLITCKQSSYTVSHIYHIDLKLKLKAQKKRKHIEVIGLHYVEHFYLRTIDEALCQFCDGDVIELSEGDHVVSGKYKIYGSLTIRAQNKELKETTTIINTKQGGQFLHCIGRGSRVVLEFVTVYCFYKTENIARVSLAAQFVGKNVSFVCNRSGGILLEHESKIYFDQCRVYDSVDAAIQMNLGCKCVMTHTMISHCGKGDDHLCTGQGAIAIFCSETAYARHLVL